MAVIWSLAMMNRVTPYIATKGWGLHCSIARRPDCYLLVCAIVVGCDPGLFARVSAGREGTRDRKLQDKALANDT